MVAKVAIVYGTRPEYLKFLPIIQYAQRESLKVIRVGQHETEFSGEVYDAYIPVPAIKGGGGGAVERLNVIGATVLSYLGCHLDGIEQVIVQGDTATAFYAALVAFQMKKKVVHLEAGMRTYDIENPYPEEGYRQMISRIASLHLTPHGHNSMYLNSETTGGPKIVVGNTILDLIRSYNLKVVREPKVLITLHRRENWGAYGAYLRELCALARRTPDYRFILLAHPNPILQDLICDTCIGMPANFEIRPPLAHKECAEEMAGCAAIITDSGGIQEEAAFLGKHIYCMRKKTERDAIPEHYLTCIESPAELAHISITTTPTHEPCHVYGTGYAVEKICTLLHIPAAAAAAAPAAPDTV